MKEYIVVGRTMAESIGVLDYFKHLFGDKVERCSYPKRTIIIGEYILKFSCQELYDRYEWIANHADVIPAYLLRRQLDTYKTSIIDKGGHND